MFGAPALDMQANLVNLAFLGGASLDEGSRQFGVSQILRGAMGSASNARSRCGVPLDALRWRLSGLTCVSRYLLARTLGTGCASRRIPCPEVDAIDPLLPVNGFLSEARVIPDQASWGGQVSGLLQTLQKTKSSACGGDEGVGCVAVDTGCQISMNETQSPASRAGAFGGRTIKALAPDRIVSRELSWRSSGAIRSPSTCARM